MNLCVRITTPTGNFHSHVGDCDENSRVLILTPEQAEWLMQVLDPEISALEEMEAEDRWPNVKASIHWARNIVSQITNYEQ